jgi:hypothetical protein
MNSQIIKQITELSIDKRRFLMLIIIFLTTLICYFSGIKNHLNELRELQSQKMELLSQVAFLSSQHQQLIINQTKIRQLTESYQKYLNQ